MSPLRRWRSRGGRGRGAGALTRLLEKERGTQDNIREPSLWPAFMSPRESIRHVAKRLAANSYVGGQGTGHVRAGRHTDTLKQHKKGSLVHEKETRLCLG